MSAITNGHDRRSFLKAGLAGATGLESASIFPDVTKSLPPRRRRPPC